jgi:predicted negative regulator of RcsB-dependent stress response
VVASSHPELASVAMVFLGDLIAEQADLTRARAAYEQALASGHREMRWRFGPQRRRYRRR